MSSYQRSFALLSATERDHIPIPQNGVHYAATVADIPIGDIVEWWYTNYENGYVYVRHEFGQREMEIDVEAVWNDLVEAGRRPHHGTEVLWTVRDWQLISGAFDSLRDGYSFSARFLIPNFDCTDYMPFWTFLMRYYRQMMLLGHEHRDNTARVEEDLELYRLLQDEDGNEYRILVENGREIIDLTGDVSTATTEPLTDIESDWEP